MGGPDIVPARLQDREAMVNKLLSMGYPRDRPICPPRYFQPGPTQADQLFDGEYKATTLAHLLNGYGIKLRVEQRISIAQRLMKNGIVALVIELLLGFEPSWN